MARALHMPELSNHHANLFYLIDATSSALLNGFLRDVAGNLLFIEGGVFDGIRCRE